MVYQQGEGVSSAVNCDCFWLWYTFDQSMFINLGVTLNCHTCKKSVYVLWEQEQIRPVTTVDALIPNVFLIHCHFNVQWTWYSDLSSDQQMGILWPYFHKCTARQTCSGRRPTTGKSRTTNIGTNVMKWTEQLMVRNKFVSWAEISKPVKHLIVRRPRAKFSYFVVLNQ